MANEHERVSLLPCPFCGRGEGSVEVHRINYNGAMIYCKHCGISGPTFGAAGFDRYEAEEHAQQVKGAVARWNRRTPPSGDREAVLEETLRELVALNDLSATEMTRDYRTHLKRRQAAWDAARTALSAAPSPTPTEQKQSDAERRWQFIRQNISPREAARLFHLADCQDHKPPEPDGEPCDIADWIDALTDAAMKSAGEKHE